MVYTQIVCGVLIDPLRNRFSGALHSGSSQVRELSQVSNRYHCSTDADFTGSLCPHRLEDESAASLSLPHLRWCWCLSVTGHHFERDAPTAVSQQLLEFVGVAADLVTVHLANYVPSVQHALPVNRTAVQDPCDHHLPPLHTESHPLKEMSSHAVNYICTS